MIIYQDSTRGFTPEQLRGFFVGWPNPPSKSTHLKLLEQSDFIELAIESKSGNVVGFITAISDGVLSAYIPFLEVLPSYQGEEIGSELARRMFGRLEGLYMVDLLCDSDVQPFYERLGMKRATGMLARHYKHQLGK